MSIFKGSQSTFSDTLKILHINAFILVLTIFWDVSSLTQVPMQEHIFTKLFFIALTYCGALLYKNRLLKDYAPIAIQTTFFLYSYYYTVHYHYSYYTAFFQYFMAGGLVLGFKKKQFFIANTIGLAILMLASQKVGMIPIVQRNLSQEITVPAVFIWFFSMMWYLSVRAIQKKAHDNDLVFSELGKISNFLLHELSSPIHRLNSSTLSDTEPLLIKEIKNITNLLNLTKALTQKNLKIELTEVNLRKVFELHTSNYQRTINHLNIKLTNSITNTSKRTSEEFINIIVKNLIENAIEYLSTSDFDNKELEIFESFEKEQYSITVSNIAKKVPKKELEQFFDPHYSTKGQTGTNQGLGLFISRSLCQAIGVDLSVKFSDNKLLFKILFN